MKKRFKISKLDIEIAQRVTLAIVQMLDFTLAIFILALAEYTLK